MSDDVAAKRFIDLSEERKRRLMKQFRPALCTSLLWFDAEYNPTNRHGLDVWKSRGFNDARNPLYKQSARDYLVAWRGAFYEEEVDAYYLGFQEGMRLAT